MILQSTLYNYYNFKLCYGILSLKIDQVNKHLDQVAQGNVERKRDDVKKALQLLLRNTSALEQVCVFVCVYFVTNTEDMMYMVNNVL